MAILASLVAIVAGSALMWAPMRDSVTVDVRVAGSVLLIAGVTALLLTLFFSNAAGFRPRPGGGPRD